jgi:type I restriction enzyme, S subunit
VIATDVVTLASVCERIVDCEHNTALTQAHGYPSIRTPNIGRGRLILDGVYRVSEETYRLWTKREVPQAGDLILAREAPVGNVAIIPEGLKVCLGQRTVLIRPDRRQVDPNYLVYLLLGDEIQGRIQSLSNGATVHHLNVKDIKELRLPSLPPLPIQRKIAGILAAYDELIENNTRRIAILEEMARELYREWFVRFRFPGHEGVRMVESVLGAIAEGWRVARLGDVCTVTMGQSPSSEFYNEAGEGLPFHQGVKDFGPRFPTDRVYCTVLDRVAERGDILLSVRAPVGRLNIATKRIVIGRGLCAIRSKIGSQAYLFQQLKEVFHEEDIMGNGAIFKAVTKSDVLAIRVIQPPPDVIAAFEEAVRPTFRQLEVLTEQNKTLRSTRDLLLPRLVSGEVDMERTEEEEATV